MPSRRWTPTISTWGAVSRTAARRPTTRPWKSVTWSASMCTNAASTRGPGVGSRATRNPPWWASFTLVRWTGVCFAWACPARRSKPAEGLYFPATCAMCSAIPISWVVTGSATWTNRCWAGPATAKNFNIGFLAVTDIPYPEMVAAARTTLGATYETRWGQVAATKTGP